MKKLLLLLLSILITACAGAPGPVKEKAHNILNGGACYNLFIKTGHGSYQDCSAAIGANCIFALVKDSQNNQACGHTMFAELVDNFCIVGCSPTSAQEEALALSRCEEAKKKFSVNINAPCKIFAINNNIVWEEEGKDAKFQ
jgi:hypothetical protein